MTRNVEATEAIKQLKSRYFRFLDTKDYSGLDSIFLDNAVVDVRGSTQDSSGSSPTVAGLDDGLMSGAQLKDFFRTSIAKLETVHHGHMPEIWFDSASSAHGIWALEDQIWFPPSGPVRKFHGWGHYHDDYSLSNGKWYVSGMRITRIKSEVIAW